MPTILEIKEQKKIAATQRRNLANIIARVRLHFQVGQIKCWKDAYKAFGYTNEYVAANFTNSASPLVFADLLAFFKKLEADLELRLNPPPIVEVILKDKNEKLPINEWHEPVQPANNLSPDESGYSNADDYGLVPSDKELAYLYYFQKKAAAEILTKLVKEKKRAVLLIAATGTGKTFIKAAVDRRLKDMNFHEGKTYGITAYLNITRSSIVEQDRRVFQNQFSILHPSETETINLEQLRARAGQMWIRCRTIIVDGEEKEIWEWKPLINPCFIMWDECQALKNDSTQSRIAIAYSKLDADTAQMFVSATPFGRVSEARAFAIATRKDISHITGIPGSILNEQTWPGFAAYIADPTGRGQGLPTDYNEAAVDRLMDELDDYIVRVKNVKWQFNAINKTEVIQFEPPSEDNNFTDTKAEYSLAWQTYLDEMAKLEKEVTDNPRFQAMIKLGKFLMAAEYAKRYILAKKAWKDFQDGYAPVIGVKHKKTVIAIVKLLNEKYGVPRNKISLIWGGGQTVLTARQKLKAKIREKEDLFKEQGITMEDLDLDDVEDRILEELPEELRLGNQNKEERQKEIDKYQAGISDFLVFTYKSGGCGLSTHHTDEMTNRWNESVPGFKEWLEKDIKNYNRCKPEAKRIKPGKVRKQANGYAYVEDIKYIPTKPRKTTLSTTWSPIEMVQAAGRPARLTSLSDTYQTMIGFAGTVEEDQLFVLTHRLKCLSKVVRQRENWMDLIKIRMRSEEESRRAARDYFRGVASSEGEF